MKTEANKTMKSFPSSGYFKYSHKLPSGCLGHSECLLNVTGMVNVRPVSGG